jgi:hypothetical protein
MINCSVLLDKEALARHINSKEFANSTEYIDVAYLREEKDQTKLEDKRLKTMIFLCTHGARTEDKKGVKSKGGQVGANKLKSIALKVHAIISFWWPISRALLTVLQFCLELLMILPVFCLC